MEPEDDPMWLERLIAHRSGVVPLHRGGEIFVRVEDAAPFLDRCASERVRVLGVDGFYARDGDLWVDLGRIADFSAIEEVDAALTSARAAVAEFGSDLPMAGFSVEQLVLSFVLERVES